MPALCPLPALRIGAQERRVRKRQKTTGRPLWTQPACAARPSPHRVVRLRLRHMHRGGERWREVERGGESVRVCVCACVRVCVRMCEFREEPSWQKASTGADKQRTAEIEDNGSSGERRWAAKNAFASTPKERNHRRLVWASAHAAVDKSTDSNTGLKKKSQTAKQKGDTMLWSGKSGG